MTQKLAKSAKFQRLKKRLKNDLKLIENWLKIDWKLIDNWLTIDWQLIENWLKIDWQLAYIEMAKLHESMIEMAWHNGSTNIGIINGYERLKMWMVEREVKLAGYDRVRKYL